MGVYIDRDDLRVALGPQKYTAYFDDDQDGVPEDEIADQVIMRAEARVNRYAIEAFSGSLPTWDTPPDGFRALAIEYAIVIAESRVSAVSRDDAERRLEAIDKDMTDVAKGLTTIEPSQPGQHASLPTTPANPPGALAASLIDFSGEGCGCTPLDWWRKEGCS